MTRDPTPLLACQEFINPFFNPEIMLQPMAAKCYSWHATLKARTAGGHPTCS